MSQAITAAASGSVGEAAASGGSRRREALRRHRRSSLVAFAGLVGIVAGVTAAVTGSQASSLRIVASGLDNPRKLFIDAGGALYVAEAGHGGSDTCYTSGGSKTCVGLSGAVTRIANGSATKVVTALPSAASTTGRNAEGPAAVVADGGTIKVLLGDGRVTANSHLGPDGGLAGDLVSTHEGTIATRRVLADFGAFEATHNPDRGAGPGAASGDPPLDSNPYALIRYRGGYAVVDAAGNDLLWLRPNGLISVLAVFPVRVEHFKPGIVGKHATTLTVQSVPTSVAAGPDGALYVGELTGYPFVVGSARIWRVNPGQKPTVYASGFTNISDIAFEGNDLLVLEIASRGLQDASSPGALYRVAPNGTRKLILSRGLVAPTGLAVRAGRIYISNYGTSPSHGPSSHGEIISIPG